LTIECVKGCPAEALHTHKYPDDFHKQVKIPIISGTSALIEVVYRADGYVGKTDRLTVYPGTNEERVSLDQLP
jgi:hypothetical protein